MIEIPKIVQSDALLTATVRFTIPRAEIARVMGPAIAEVMAAVFAQGMAPAGPVFSHHFKMSPETFDFEVGVPVSKSIVATGRVKPSSLPAARVARTEYRGPYEGLGAAWGEFEAWLAANGHKTAPNLWEFYVSGPESGADPSQWRTQFNRPLA